MRRVSIVIPNYNYGQFIGRTLDSVLRQSYTDWEIIVVDDNSTDSSRSVVQNYIRNYPDRQISLIHHPYGPSGTPCPVNIGIREMRGEFFAWLSSDDVFESDKLEKQLLAFAHNPKLGLVHTAFQTIDEHGCINGSFTPPDEFESDAFTALIEGNFINGNTVLIRKAVLDAAGPFIESDNEIPELWRAAEYFHWLTVASQHPIQCIQQTLHRSRRHSGNSAYNESSTGPALERILIRRFLKENPLQFTASIVVALCGRGLWREAIDGMQRMNESERAYALVLLQSLEEDQERWDTRHYDNIRNLDKARIRTAFRSDDAEQTRAMLETVGRLKCPQNKSYRDAALRKLACLA